MGGMPCTKCPSFRLHNNAYVAYLLKCLWRSCSNFKKWHLTHLWWRRKPNPTREAPYCYEYFLNTHYQNSLWSQCQVAPLYLHHSFHLDINFVGFGVEMIGSLGWVRTVVQVLSKLCRFCSRDDQIVGSGLFEALKLKRHEMKVVQWARPMVWARAPQVIMDIYR